MTLRIDAALVDVDLRSVGDRARSIEALGYDGAFTFEGPHDPFLPLALAAATTSRIEVTTAVAIAFARSPMTLAHTARDLNDLAEGRAILGLGSQVRAHVERRFSMPWSHPAARMREFTLALRAIWGAWQDRTPLRFEGEHYRHTLMTPFFDPGPSPHGIPRLHLAGVGPAMTEVAGEVADGFLVHPFSTPEYVREVTRPALARGAARAGRSLDGFEITWPVMVVSGVDEAATDVARQVVRTQIAFYASTPAYRAVLDHHGLGDLQPELQRLTREGRWAEMPDLVDDDLLGLLAVEATPDRVGAAIRDRVGDLVDRVSVNAPYETDPAAWADVVTAIHAG